MKTRSLLPIAVVVMFAASGCDKQSPEISKKIAELEQRNNEAAERQRELEQQIEDQKLAAERDAIERERAQIEEDRAELQRQEGEAAAERDATLREREEAIAKREGRLEQVQESLAEKEDKLGERDAELTDRDRELAGREALDFDATEQDVPVGDYGTFYDSLSSYGSWFETSDYGYVWQPAVVRDVGWRPYCRGRWVCSDRGWTWVSEEPFGWATYHYGRWALIRGRGWVWVPGTEWAPCWVSWRESDSHIGWAPLPPETMAYRGQGCDSTVDVRFGIGAICFNFVEIRHFGSPLFRHCLPTAANFGFYDQTTNITYIHHQNRYVICGGPRYQKISDRIGKPLPFYRLEVDQHPRVGRDPLAMRPQVNGGRLRIAAPNMDADWNAELRPKQVRGRIETVNVERGGVLNSEITDRFRQSREEDRQRADKSIVDLGGRERFEERRTEQLNDNRRGVEGKLREADNRVVGSHPDRPKRDIVENREGLRVPLPAKRNPLPDGMTRPSDPKTGRLGNGNSPDDSQAKVEPRVPQTSTTVDRRTAEGQAGGPRVLPAETTKRQEVPENRRQAENRTGNGRQAEQAADTEKETTNRKQQEQAQQRQAEQAREAQNEAMRRKQEEQAQQKQQRQEEQARKQAMEEQREQARQQQQADNEARRQQQEQREMQRQQEESRQRQQEEARQQRQQEEAQQRQQEQARQREQEQARQREQEQSRQREQEQARQQQQQKDDDDQKKRNR